nr:uncharacterized mitochondrial protein AtMg00810-like [Tanacetum cinerariifolium]
MCARYQARPTKKHVHALKRIFRYLRGTVHRGLWYLKDSSVVLTAFADANHAGCQDTRRSTFGSVQFLGERTMDTTIKQQLAMDEALVHMAKRLKIGRRNFRLLSDTMSKESTLQLVYDVLRRCPFFNAFLVTVDVSEIYMQEFWATTTVHYHSIRFKMDTKKHIIDLESFRDILHICPRVHGQPFAEPPNSKAYKEYYAITTGESAPKPKASVRRTISSSDTSITPPTAATSQRLKASAKGKQTAKASKAKSADEGTSSKPGVPVVPTDESEEELSWNSIDDEGDDNEQQDDDGDEEDEGDDGEEGDDDDVDQEVVRDDDKDDVEEGGDDEQEIDEETREEESFDHIPQTPENSEDEGDGKEDQGLNIGEEERLNEEEEEDELYRDVNINQGRGLQATLEVKDTYVTLTPIKPDGMDSIFETTSRIDVQTPTSVAPLPITTPTMTSSTIATTITTSQPPILPTTVPSDIIQNIPCFGSLFCFDDRLRSLEENFSEVMQTNQFAGAVSAIPRIVQHYMDQRMNKAVKVAVQIQSDRLCDEPQRENDEFLRTAVNEQLKAEVLTRSSHSSRTSYAVTTDLSEMELKKILIEKMEGNKSIQGSDEQRNLYKALVKAYESDKILLDTYGETVTLKRRRDDDEDKDEEPFAGPDWGTKKRIEGKEPELASAVSETDTKSAGRSTTGSRSRQASASESAFAEEPPQKPPTLDCDWNKTLPSIHGSIQPWISKLVKQADTRSSFNELMDTLLDFSNFIMNQLRFDTLTPELLAGPTNDLMKGSCKSLIELEYHLEKVYKATTDQLDWVNPKGQQYPHNLLQPLPLIPDNRGRRVIPFAHFINNNLEYLRGATCGRPSTGVKSYEKRLNLMKPDTYRLDLKRKEAYTAYSNPRGFIYQNKDKKNRLMRIDELHKFSDGTLTDVRTTLDDHLKGIRMRETSGCYKGPYDLSYADHIFQEPSIMLEIGEISSLAPFLGYGGSGDGDELLPSGF